MEGGGVVIKENNFVQMKDTILFQEGITTK